MKVICAGLQKTGTKSMAEALRILGYNVHDVFHQFFYDKELWDKVLDNTATIQDYQRVLEDVDAVTDFPGCVLWEQILEAFPNAKVILMVRSTEEEWYKSVKYHFARMSNLGHNVLMYPFLNIIFGSTHWRFLKHNASFIPACLGTVYPWGRDTEVLLRSRYRQHNMYVKATCPKENLLVYDIKQGWEPLCKFLSKDVPERSFPLKNAKAEIVDQCATGNFEHDCGYYRLVKRETLVRIFFLLAILIVIVAWLISRF